MDITAPNLEQFFQRLHFTFQSAYQKTPTLWDKIASEYPSTTEQEVHSWLDMVPGIREWVGPRVINNVVARAFAVVNKHFEGTWAIDINKLKDDTYGIYSQMQPLIAAQVAEFRDRRIATVVEAGTTALGWDAQFFFDTDHPVNLDNAALGNQSNKLVGAGYDIAVADPLVPFAAARAAMAIWKRNDGEQAGVMGNLIMVHPNEEKYALQIAQALTTAQAINANSGAGVSNVYSGKVDVLVNPYLKVTAGRPWYLLATNRGIMPFLWQNRQDPNFVVRDLLTSENIFKLRQIEWGIDFRGEATYSFPMLAFRMSAS